MLVDVFNGCSLLEFINVGYNSAGCTYYNGCFSGCGQLRVIYINKLASGSFPTITNTPNIRTIINATHTTVLPNNFFNGMTFLETFDQTDSKQINIQQFTG